MKKRIIAALLIATSLVCTGCASTTEIKSFGKAYSLYGRYYLDGTFIDENGEAWEFHTSEIGGRPVYDGMPIYVIVRDNGTPTLSDDEIRLSGIDYVTEVADHWENYLNEN